MKKGKIIIISGPSGSGKTTLYKKLLTSRKDLVKSISVTTRPKRAGEVHGRDYLFVSLKMFLYKRKAGHFLESEKVFNNYYGTPGKNVQRLLKEGKNVLLCIDVKGAKVVCRKNSKAKKIFIKPPSVKELRERLEKRGSETKKVVDLRIKTAKEELAEAPGYDYVVVNDQLSKAYRKLETVINSIIKDS